MAHQHATSSTASAVTPAVIRLKRPYGAAFSVRLSSRVFSVVAFGLAAVAIQTSPATAQETAKTAMTRIVDCPNPESQDFVMPPEFVSSDGILRGTINLKEEFRRLPPAQAGAPCRGALVRVFTGEGLPLVPPAAKPFPGYADAIPGPTLRARVGDLVQLKFLNSINPNRFDDNLDIEACTEVGKGGQVYPAGGANTPRFQDEFPNCLHASSTANIHFHGTHTNPNATGDNVYLQIRPLPRDNQGELTTKPLEAMAGFEEFFKKCAENLQNPLNAWPATWADLRPLPKSWTDKQTELLVAYQQKNPSQRLWDENQKVLKDSWPIYYVGAFPYCFALPAYTAATWPPPPGSASPIMGQAPGTHWYHAHKHGSTAVNVANGMTGAFIIEGKYDDDLDAAYGSYILKEGNAWNARSQKVLVLNQLMSANPNAMTSRPVFSGPGVDFSVNGRLRPRIKMQPGEVQLWRIVNTSGRTAAYFMPPEGLEWRQLAQDGVQYADANYQRSLNKPFYMAPANRVDLLVKAAMNMNGKSAEVRIQNVMARSMVQPSPAQPNPVPGTVLLIVDVAGPPVMRDGKPTEMPFLATPPKQPAFLADISDDEMKQNNYIKRTLVFDSKAPVFDLTGTSMARQHTINDMQFADGHAHLNILLGATEEWTIVNKTNMRDGPFNSAIDHPLHIHINPFQVTEFFDPNEILTDPDTGQVVSVLQGGQNTPVPRYFLTGQPRIDLRQCELDPDDEATWREGGKVQEGPCLKVKGSSLVWWYVFAIPAGRPAVKNKDGTAVTIPGYYKMRSRFVDYPGLYVMHCHILIHEDRGMMFSVEVLRTKSAPVRHH
jgi:FtsP/CotA-like multicopper oxidase with cupredoxin domain